MLAAMLLLCLAQAPVQAQELVPDPAFNILSVKPGDVLSVWSDDGEALVALDYFAFLEMVKSLKAGDGKGVGELVRRQRIVLTKSGIQARVLQMTKEIDGSITGAEVRLQNAKGETLKGWVFWSNLTRLVPASEVNAQADAERRAGERQTLQQYLNAPFKPGKPRPRPPADAKTMWARAQAVEKTDPKLAAMYCRALAKGHPSAPEVKLSREMLGRLK